MNWSYLITFAVCLGVYLLGLFVFSLIKKHKNKKKLENEIAKDEKREEETKK